MDQIKHYKIIETLGSGGMGKVYKAFDTILERHVAIKLMHSHLMNDEKSDDRFMSEARAAARLVHPNVVTIYEVGIDACGRYIAMEYVEGRALSALLTTDGAQSTEQALHLVMQIVSCLNAAHEMGIVHRDIKPDNILVTPQRVAKILDFGIARIAMGRGLTVAGDVMGTVEYMAPEQMMGDAVDHRCDLYSLGVVLYQILTNRLPFMGENPVAILYKQLNEKPIPPSRYNSSIRMELDNLVLKALESDRHRRWQNAQEFLEALQDVRQNTNTGALAVKKPLFQVDIDHEQLGLTDEDDALIEVFVGREKELRKLIQNFQSAVQGNGQTVILKGEAGVGKSTLGTIFQEYTTQNGAIVLYGACLYQEGMDAYLPYIEAFREFFNLASFELGNEERTRLKSLVSEKVPLLMEFTERFATNFAGAPVAHADSRALHAGNQLEGIHLLVSTLSTMKPIVLIIDDLQWADEASLRLFHYLSRNIARNRVLLIGITRSDRYDLQQNGKPAMIVDVLSRMEWEGIAKFIMVNRLKRAECDLLIDEALKQTVFSDEFYERLFRETRGNPFIVLETLKNLRQSGGIYFEKGAWYDRQKAIHFDVPDRVEDVFVRRLNDISAEEREVLQVAAVVGYKFDPSILSAILEMSKIKLLKMLQKFDRDLELIVSTDEGFQFEHPMLRDLLYNEVPRPLRKEYHLMIAAQFEKLYGPQYGLHIGDAAQHFFRGGADAKAIPLLYKAATRAFKMYAYHEASLSYADMLTAISRSELPFPETVSQLDTYLKLGICLEETGQYDQSLDAYQKLLKKAEEDDDLRGQVEALRRLGRIYDKLTQWELALEVLLRSLRILEQHPMPNSLSRVYNNIGAIYLQQGQFEFALEYLHKTIVAVDHEMGEYDRAHALTNIGIIHNIRGEHHDAVTFYKQALAIYKIKGDERGQATIHHNLGMAYSDLKMWEECTGEYQLCYALAEKLQDKNLRALTLLNSGKAYALQENVAKAEESAKKALKIFQSMDDKLNVAEAFHVLGMIYATRHSHQKATKYFQESIKINEQANYQEGLGEVYLTYANSLLETGNAKEAQEYFNKAESTFSQLGLHDKSKNAQQRLQALQGRANGEIIVVDLVNEKQIHATAPAVSSLNNSRIWLFSLMVGSSG